MSEKVLGKITAAKFGYGGYQDMQFGAWFCLQWGGGMGTWRSIEGGWALNIKCRESCDWTEEDRTRGFGEAMRAINQLMLDAKVTDFSALVGKPIEVEVEHLQLKSWRILKEVL